MSKQKSKPKHKNILRNINLAMVFLSIALNIVLFFFFSYNKTLFLAISTIVNIYLFLFHWFFFIKITRHNLNDIKNEAYYTNYGSSIITFVLCIFIVLLISSGLLFFINKEALNITMISMFYVSILTMLLPSIILLAYTFFIFPSLIVPGLTMKKYYQTNSMTILFTVFILVSILFLCKFIMIYLYDNNFLKQIKYKVDKISVEYSTKFLSINDEITPTEKRTIKNIKLSIPFLYTRDGFFYKDYNDAKMFCDSMDARLPNYLEMYNIAFNKFNTFGENYYWTSTNEERDPLLIHFNNMSYSLVHNKNGINPIVYCVSEITEEEKSRPKIERKYFIRKINKRIKPNYINIEQQESMEELALLSKLNKVTPEPTKTNEERAFQDEIKHVNFSVKEVSGDIMASLIKKGYVYNKPTFRINQKYKIIPEEITSKIEKDPKKKQIRLCYYPFIDYGDMTIEEEAQIWQQSFCSPAFELIQYYPQITSVYDKEPYCKSLGGRLPNIPELVGILKTYSKGKTGIKYWTNNYVKESSSGINYPLSVYFKDATFLVPNMTEKSGMAYTYCIKDSKHPSKLITNYESRFKGLEGKNIAKNICPDCRYQEVPDTILLQN